MSASAAMARRADAVARYLQGYRETMDWPYSDPAALVAYGAPLSPEQLMTLIQVQPKT